jgi:hypothetical protein
MKKGRNEKTATAIMHSDGIEGFKGKSSGIGWWS